MNIKYSVTLKSPWVGVHLVKHSSNGFDVVHGVHHNSSCSGYLHNVLFINRYKDFRVRKKRIQMQMVKKNLNHVFIW